MEKTNFTFVKAFRLFLPLMMLFSFSTVNAQIACNDNVQVSVAATPTDGLCTVALTADMVSEADAGDFVQIFDGPTLVAEGAPAIIDGADDHFGESLTVRVYEGADATGNYCWGSITIEDKAAPVVTCTPIDIDCAQAVPAVGTDVTAADNCSGASIELTDQSTNDTNNCTSGTIITREYVAIDGSGNVSAPCVQTITITRVTDVTFPADIAWSCSQYTANPSIIDATVLLPLDADADLLDECQVADITLVNTENDGLVGTLDGTAVTNSECLKVTGSGIPSVAAGIYCNFAVSSSDEFLELCGNDTSDNLFKIIRTWTVLDWCTNSLVTTGANNEDNIQIIKVVDIVAPVITVGNQTVSASIPGQHPQPCSSQSCLETPVITDNCSAFTYEIYTPVGAAVAGPNGCLRIPAPGLGIGVHDVTYVATDACGNTSELTVTVTVADDVTPTPVCDEITQVAIGGNGIATVYAETFDDGSNDNCGIESFTVRKMGDDICDAGTNPNDNGQDNEQFDGEVSFCCAEIGTSVTVILRVTDYYGNTNDCMVEVLVEDKLAPYKVQDVASGFNISCEDYFTNYAPVLDVAAANGEANPQILIDAFGDVSYDDNCEAITSVSFAYNVNSCGVGTITRNWTVTDPSGNNGESCSQTINVYHINDWSIEFPQDVDLNCEAGQDEIAGEDFGEPVVYDDNCELIAISVDDVRFNVVPDACYKIIRTYTAINWCVYDGDNLNDDRLRSTTAAVSTLPGGTNSPTFEDGGNDSNSGNAQSDLYTDVENFNTSNDDGIVVYQQVIKINDDVAPVITNPGTQDYCINASTDADGDCDRSIELPEAVVSDCVEAADLTTTYAVAGLGTGRNYSNVAPGTYTVTVTSVDNCGNQSSIQYDVVVRDCKAPTPYCVGGLVVELMPIDNDGDGQPDAGMVELWSSDFDAGSFDNCTAQADLKLRSSLADNGFAAATTNLMFDCSHAGPTPVYLYIQDEANNVDYCLTTVFIESVPNVCNGTGGPDESQEIAGALATENNAPLAGASVNGAITNEEGAYTTTATTGTDVTVTPEYNVYDNTSVTTFDLLQIRKHILTTELLDSPYKMIAADINNNQAITAADLVAARQVILGMATSYPNNNAWAFVDASYTFPANWSLTDGYPAVTNFNNIAADQAANFVAVRVGDVNGTFGFADSADERNSMIINANDATLAAGQEVTVEFSAADAVLGYQFTLNFENLEVVSIDGNEENFGVFANAITTSFDAKASDRLFSVTFKATADVTVSEAIVLTSNITTAEAYSANGAMNIALEFAGANADFVLNQNTPNPVKDITNVSFNLPTAGSATITVSDMTGKVVSVINGEYAKGYNEVTLSNLPAGVLTYTLANADFTATKTMVVVK